MARSIARVPGGSRLGGVARALTAPLIGAIGSPKLAGLLELGGSMAGAYLLRRGLYMPWELADVIDPELAHEGLKALSPLASLEATIPETPSAHLQVSALELAWYMRSQLLRDADWAGMAHGLEIRVPFVDLEIFRKVLPIAAAAGLRKRDALAACMSPEALAGLPTTKMGFEVPIRRWMEGHPGVTGERGLRGWARFVYARHFPRSPKYAAKRFAIFRIGHLGDAIVSMPAIAALRSANPDASLLLLTNEPPNGQMVSLGQVLGATGWFDQTIEYPTRGPWLVRALAIVRAIRKLRAFAPQVVYCLPPNRTRWQRMRDDWVFRRLAKAGRIIDAGIPESDLSGLQRQTRVTPEWKRFLDVVGMPPIEGFRLVLPEATRARAGEILAAHGLDPGAELVAVGPGSKMPAKVWPRERFVDVGRRILRSRRAHLLVLGGAEDKSLGDALCSAWGTRCTNLAGALKIDEALAVLSHCVLYVGNDTGTMHAAAIVGVPCVAIFSARDLPGLWEPYGDQHEILRANVDCAGCMLETCTQHGNKCLTAISVDEVEQAAHRRLPVQWVRIEAKQS
jgi:ADP-heptose:LPS heptosyltransferase